MPARRRSPVVIGRDRELHAIGDLLTAARSGRGNAIFIVGEGGIGKSRLVLAAAELGGAANMRLMRGRGSSVGPAVPFRSLIEALLSLSRDQNAIDVSALGPYRRILASLIPDWGDAATQDSDSVVVLAEGVLRLAGLAGRGRGCLLALDDLHDADAMTLAVVEYLIDNLDRQPTALIATIHADSCRALRLARSAAQRGTALLFELDPLSHDDLGVLAAACLGIDAADVPGSSVELLWAASAGNPLVAEDLVNSMADGLLVAQDGSGQLGERPHASLLSTFTRTLTRRVDLLDPVAKDVLQAAAMLGTRFPLQVVRAATGVSDEDLQASLARQLVAADEQAEGWYAFRHQLLPKAMLANLAPTRRAALAGKVASALSAVYPGLPGDWCQLAATLLVEAGERAAAGRLFTEVGRRALARGAAAPAVTLLNRALELLPAGDGAARADAIATLLDAFVEAGLAEQAVASSEALDQIDGRLDPCRRAGLRGRLAWAALAAGKSDVAMAQIDAARALLGRNAAPGDAAPLDVVAAYLALEATGCDGLGEAETLARRALAAAEAAAQPETTCKALLLLGAVIRCRDPHQARTLLERAHAIAIQHDMAIAAIHALVQRGNDDALHTGAMERLRQARELATDTGAVSARYQAEISIALHSVLLGEFATAGSLAGRVLAAATRSGLAPITRQALLVGAVLAAHRGQRREMEQALAEFRRWRGNEQPMYASWVHGLARAFCALLNEDRDRARDGLFQARYADGSNPTIYPLGGRYGIQLLLDTLAGKATWSDCNAITQAAAGQHRWDRQFALLARAVLHGRSGHAADATASMAEALRAGVPYPVARNLGLRLVAEAAIADRWGSPVEWLRSAEEYFDSAGVPAVARACRGLLRSAGLRIGQRRNGVNSIPKSLRAAGVTVREYEVLCFLAARLRNREIADRLHVSPRTVEGYVSSLIVKTGLPDRLALSRLAATAITTEATSESHAQRVSTGDRRTISRRA